MSGIIPESRHKSFIGYTEPLGKSISKLDSLDRATSYTNIFKTNLEFLKKNVKFDNAELLQEVQVSAPLGHTPGYGYCSVAKWSDLVVLWSEFGPF